MEICVIENGATVKLKANLEIQQIEAEKQSQEEARRQAIVEPLAFELFKKCAEMVENRSRGKSSFSFYIYDSTISPAYPSYEFKPSNFEKKIEDIKAAFVIVKELLEKANYKVNNLWTYSYNWYCRSDRIGSISFSALD